VICTHGAVWTRPAAVVVIIITLAAILITIGLTHFINPAILIRVIVIVVVVVAAAVEVVRI
jgi:hypothetical protein